MIPTVQDLRQSWNAFARTYSDILERSNLQLGLSLSRMLRVSSAKSILEVGCGSGRLTVDLLQTLPPGIKYTSVDLSDEMINLATERKKTVETKLNDIEHTFVNGNAEDLSFIPDESVDVFISSLCLHLTTDPNKALKEAMRVLKKGGRIGFTVLGSYELSTLFNLVSDSIKKFDVQLPQRRSIFWLGDRDTLIKLAKDNGFEVDYCWKEIVTVGVFEEEEVEWIAKSPSNAKTYGVLDQETQAKVLEVMKKEFMEKKKNSIPLQTDNVLLIGRKPLN